MTTIAALINDIDDLNKKRSEKISLLYKKYVECFEKYSAENRTFNVSTSNDRDLLTEIQNNIYLSDVQKTILFSLAYYTTDELDHSSMSYTLKYFLESFNTVLNSDFDEATKIRDIYTQVYTHLDRRVNVYPLKDNYILHKLFSYNDGVTLEMFRNVGSALAVYEKDCTSLMCSTNPCVRFKKGVGYLNFSHASGSSMFWYIHRLFQNSSDDTITIPVDHSDDKVELNRDTFDVVYITAKDGKSVSKTYEFDLSYVREVKFNNAQAAYENLEKMKEIISQGYSCDSTKCPSTIMYGLSEFFRHIHLDMNDEYSLRTQEKEKIKSLINVVNGK